MSDEVGTTTGLIQACGASLHYEFASAGPVLVLIHSRLAASRTGLIHPRMGDWTRFTSRRWCWSGQVVFHPRCVSLNALPGPFPAYGKWSSQAWRTC